MRLNIKPLSVNEAWKGRRFRTDKYNNYIRGVLLILPPLNVPNGELALDITFGLSSGSADIDNPLKCFIDCLQKKYGFDDKMIFKLVVEKVIVKKGAEFIEWELRGL
jgi:Holliday junction resolvase RusA-like endonuclease